MMEVVDIRLLVSDVDRTIAFYRDRLGLATKLVVDGTYVEFDTAPATLTAYRSDLMDDVLGASSPPGVGSVVVAKVDDVDVAFGALRDRGVEFVTEPHDQQTWGLRVCHLRDPDGHVVELYHPLPSS
jgi:lactoylglutathione lyase